MRLVFVTFTGISQYIDHYIIDALARNVLTINLNIFNKYKVDRQDL